MVKTYYKNLLIAIAAFSLSCSSDNSTSHMKYYGEKTLSPTGDTLYYTLPEFEFLDQDSIKVNNETVKGKVYVTDFFFTTCPTICPRMKDQMIRVYNEFKTNDDVKIISHTIDPNHDTIPLLNDFAYNKLEIEKGIWHFVTGEKEKIYDLALNYMITAGEDGTEPGGYVHSGKFILIDQQGHIRGYYDGTDPLTVADMMRDMKVLLDENKK